MSDESAVPDGSAVRADFVVFDLGEVLTAPPSHLVELAALAVGADPDAFATAYRAHRLPYDAGTSPTSYWTQVLRDVGAPATPELVRTLTDLDVDARTVPTDDALALLHDVHASAAGLGLVSNAPEPLARAVREQQWAAWFDVLVFSSEVGRTKPSREIYALATERFGVAPGAVLFFDDRPVNVTAARGEGWRAHRWTGAEAARRVLVDAGVL